MTGLEPGGRYSRTAFTRRQAGQRLEQLIAELNGWGPETSQDRRVQVRNGDTFRERWERGGRETMTADLRRAGVLPDQQDEDPRSEST